MLALLSVHVSLPATPRTPASNSSTHKSASTHYATLWDIQTAAEPKYVVLQTLLSGVETPNHSRSSSIAASGEGHNI